MSENSSSQGMKGINALDKEVKGSRIFDGGGGYMVGSKTFQLYGQGDLYVKQ